MSETPWYLGGVDPAVLEQAADEAARLGLSLSDYLADVLHAGDEDTPPPPFAFEPEAAAIRPRLHALNQRLGASLAELDEALEVLDAGMTAFDHRLKSVEGLAGVSAAALADETRDLRANLEELKNGLAALDDVAAAHADAGRAADSELAAACGELENRLDTVESIARAAERAAAALADAQQSLQRTVSDEIGALERDSNLRLNAGLDQMRAAADSAAAHADGVARQMLAELRGARQALEKRVTDSAAETKTRMQAAFADVAERFTTVTNRVAAAEREHERAAEQTRAQFKDLESGILGALEESALTLRRADAHLAADLARLSEDSRAELAALRNDVAGALSNLRQHHTAAEARLAQAESGLAHAESHHAEAASAIAALAHRGAVADDRFERTDAALARAGADLAATREALESRLSETAADLRHALAGADLNWAEQFDGAAQRTSELEKDIAHVRRTMGAEIERVEACTLAALEKQSGDRKELAARLQKAIEAEAKSARTADEETRQSLDRELAALRTLHTGLKSRLDVIDGALAGNGAVGAKLATLTNQVSTLSAQQMSTAERLARTERADAEAGKAMDALRSRIDAVAHKTAADAERALHSALTDMRERLAACETENRGASGRIDGLVGALDRAVAQAGETADRTGQIERDLAHLRADVAARPEPPSRDELMLTVESRLAAFENRQADALDGLQNAISQFVSDNERRLAQLEVVDLAPFDAIERRLADLEQRDLAGAFAELRQRMEERIIGVEQRSVRALEQVSETVAAIEERLFAEDEPAHRSA